MNDDDLQTVYYFAYDEEESEFPRWYVPLLVLIVLIGIALAATGN